MIMNKIVHLNFVEGNKLAEILRNEKKSLILINRKKTIHKVYLSSTCIWTVLNKAAYDGVAI
jgi:hypothetical protein